MTDEQKAARHEARYSGKRAHDNIKTALAAQHQIDAWQALAKLAQVDHDTSTWRTQADRAERQAVDCARRAWRYALRSEGQVQS